MKYLTGILLISLLFGCARYRPFADNVIEESAEPLSKSIFMVTNDTIENITVKGTAFALNWKGKDGLMTAWHVISRGFPYLTVYGNGVRLKCGPFIQVMDQDIAWCEMKLPVNWVPLQTAEATLSYGRVNAWGYPETDKRLTNFLGEDEGQAYFLDRKSLLIRKVSGVAIPGMSGGPVLDSNNHVFAIISHTSWPMHKVHYPVLLP